MSLLQAGLSRRSPVVLPAPLPACRHRVQRRPRRAGTRRSPDGRSAPPSAPAGHATTVCAIRSATRRHPEHLDAAAMRLRDLHRLHRGREVASPRTSGSRSCTGFPSDPSRTPRATAHPPRRALVGLHLLIRLPHRPLRNIERLAWRFQLAHAAPPGLPVDSNEQQPRMTRPLRSTPITGASPLLRAGPPAHPATVLSSLAVSAARRAPSRPPARSRGGSVGSAFSRSTRKPQTRLASPPCRTPPGQ